MKQYTFIDGRKDKFGKYWVLWSLGNYAYEIEDRVGDRTHRFDGDFDYAKQFFQAFCEAY